VHVAARAEWAERARTAVVRSWENMITSVMFKKKVLSWLRRADKRRGKREEDENEEEQDAG